MALYKAGGISRRHLESCLNSCVNDQTRQINDSDLALIPIPNLDYGWEDGYFLVELQAYLGEEINVYNGSKVFS